MESVPLEAFILHGVASVSKDNKRGTQSTEVFSDHVHFARVGKYK